jgi:hypothetical protein
MKPGPTRKVKASLYRRFRKRLALLNGPQGQRERKCRVACDDGSMARPIKTSDADNVLCYCLQNTVDVEGRIARKAF